MTGDHEVDFQAVDKVTVAFCMLFSIFNKAINALNNEEFQTIKKCCLSRTDRADKQLYNSLHHASDSEQLFEALAPCCNWMCIEFLETIAASYIPIKDNSLYRLIQNYSSVIFSKKLREIWNFLPYYTVKKKYYTEMTAIFDDKDPEDLTVEELNQRKPELAKEIAYHITVIRTQSLLISWLIPTNKVYQMYLRFLTISQKSRKDCLIKFGNWTAYLPCCVLCEEQKKFG